MQGSNIAARPTQCVPGARAPVAARLLTPNPQTKPKSQDTSGAFWRDQFRFTIMATQRLRSALEAKENLRTVRSVVEADPDVLRLFDVLHFACRCEAPLEVVKYLYQEQPHSISTWDFSGKLPFHYAIRNDSAETVEIVEFLMENNPSYEVGEQNQWHLLHYVCCHYPGVNLMKHMVKKYPEALLMRDGLGRLPLHARALARRSALTLKQEFSRHSTLTPEQEFADLIDANPFALVAQDSIGFTPAQFCPFAERHRYLDECEQRVRN
jgi:ankyrin repeat protein